MSLPLIQPHQVLISTGLGPALIPARVEQSQPWVCPRLLTCWRKPWGHSAPGKWHSKVSGPSWMVGLCCSWPQEETMDMRAWDRIPIASEEAGFTRSKLEGSGETFLLPTVTWKEVLLRAELGNSVSGHRLSPGFPSMPQAALPSSP